MVRKRLKAGVFMDNIEYLSAFSDALDGAIRVEEYPGGPLYIRMSHELATDVAVELREIAFRVKREDDSR